MHRQKTSLNHSPYTIQKLSNFCRVRQKRRKIAAKIAENTRFQISHFVLPPIGHCGETFNIGPQLHLFRYRMASKVCVHNIPPSGHFLNHSRTFNNLWCPQLKKLSEIFYIGAHLQSRGYKLLVELYL